MIRLIYRSKAAVPFDGPALCDLLVQSRARNLELGITGMLLYDYGAFLQVLEGDDPAVEAVWRSIRADSRHTSVHLLLQEPVHTREFARWSMGFVDLNSHSHPPPPDSASLPLPSIEAEASRAKRYLRTFQEDLYARLLRQESTAAWLAPCRATR